MKRLILGLTILSLVTIGAVAYAQGPGMMGGGYDMGPGMMESEQGKESQTQKTTVGADIFNSNCRVCHVNGGNTIYPSMPLKGSTKLANFETFLSFIRNPKLPDGSRGPMPSFSKSQISDKQAEELYQFITSPESDLMSGDPGGWYCPQYAQCRGSQTRYPMGFGMMGGQGMMQGYGGYRMGPGMMGSGQQGWNYCPYCGQYLGKGGGYGMMGGGYGGYHMGPGMMGPGYYGQSEACQNFMNDTVEQRKELMNKRYDYFEAIRNPKTTPETAAQLEKELREAQGKIYSKAPQGCWMQ